MASPRYITKALTAAVVNNIAQSQTPAGTPAVFTLNGAAVTGGVAVLDSQRQVLFTPAGNETGHTFTLTGTDQDGATISETLAGTNATAFASVRSYKTVTRITINTTAAGNIQVGTNTIGDTQWQIVNRDVSPVNIGLAFVLVSGSVTTTVSYTYDDPSNTFPGNNPPVAFDIAALTGKSSSTDGGVFNIPVAAIRMRITTGTGTAMLQMVQAGVLP